MLNLTREQVVGNLKNDCVDNDSDWVKMPKDFAKWIYLDWLSMYDLLREIDDVDGYHLAKIIQNKIRALIGD